jgi:hypothetical protein
MPTATYIALANITLSGTDSEIEFASIPATYRDLVLVITGGISSGVANVRMTLNSDTTDANYSWVQMSGTGSATSSTTPSNGEQRYINYFGYPEADLHMNILVNLMDYSATDKHKTYLSRANQADNGVTALAGRWGNTNAVTNIKITPTASTFRADSTFALYGIVS